MQHFTRLKRNPNLLDQYDNIFKEQLKTGIIEEVNEEVVVGQIRYVPPPSPNEKRQNS